MRAQENSAYIGLLRAIRKLLYVRDGRTQKNGKRENSDEPNRDEQAQESKATQISVGGAVLDRAMHYVM